MQNCRLFALKFKSFGFKENAMKYVFLIASCSTIISFVEICSDSVNNSIICSNFSG